MVRRHLYALEAVLSLVFEAPQPWKLIGPAWRSYRALRKAEPGEDTMIGIVPLMLAVGAQPEKKES